MYYLVMCIPFYNKFIFSLYFEMYEVVLFYLLQGRLNVSSVMGIITD